jgi:apolipoprotein N-acyltransferase
MIGLTPILFWENQWKENPKHLLKTWFGSYLYFALFFFFVMWWSKNAAWIAVISSVSITALFYASFFTIFAFIRKQLKNKMGYLSLLILWISWEYIELQDWDLSWPWMTLGFSLADHHPLIQWYSYTGALGGSLWLLLCNIFLYSIYQAWKHNKAFLFPRLRMFLFISVVPIVISLIQFWSYELQEEKGKFMVVQPNIDPYTEKFAGTGGSLSPITQVRMMLEEIEQNWEDDIDFVLLPETAVPEMIWKDGVDYSTELILLKNWNRNHRNTNLITGVNYSERIEIKKGEEIPFDVKRSRYNGQFYKNFNSAFHINQEGIQGLYHKSKLVIGVERLPSYFVSLGRYLTEFEEDQTATEYNPNNGTQETRTVFSNQDSSIVIGPIICYESVFGEFVGEFVEKGANVLGIITNDAWWGDTPGYKQHFAFAKMRAIETRRSIARSANTGWSGFILPTGEVLEKSEYWTKTAMVQDIPLNEEKTFYTQHGDYLGRVALPLCVLVIANAFIRRTKNKTQLGRIS